MTTSKNGGAWLCGRRPVLELLRSGSPIERIYLVSGLAPSSTLGDIRRKARAAAVPVETISKERMETLTQGANHQGVAAETGEFAYADFNALLGISQACLLFLDGVVDPHNVGSLLRSADGAGFSGVVLRERRAVGVTSTVRRVSAGAAEVVPVARVTNLSRSLERARSAGLWSVGLDAKAADDLWTCRLLEAPVALVLGAEDKGLSKPVAKACDLLVKIPSRGRLRSLNVATAGALAMFEVYRRSFSRET